MEAGVGDLRRVIRLDVSTGFVREVTVVTGYEELRGSWATCRPGEVRFGEEAIPVAGFGDSYLLTPNLFQGENRSGFDLEYRLGMRPGPRRLYLRPVLVRDSDDGYIARVLPDLCVVHNGIRVDAAGRLLPGIDVARLTSLQQFLTCTWNVDDYLRKANPHFGGEFPEVWRAVEAFSGRIVNQLLLSVSFNCRSSPEWFLPEAEKVHLDGLVARTRAALSAGTRVGHNQALLHVRNLNCYMVYFNNYWPLRLLRREGTNIAPHSLEIFLRDPGGGAVMDEVKCEAVTVLIQLARKTPEQLAVLVPRFEATFGDPAARVENPLMYLMAVMVRLWPERFSPAAIRVFLEFLFRTFFQFRKLESYNYCRFFPDDVGETIYSALVGVVESFPQFTPIIRAATKRYLTASDRLLSRYASPILVKCSSRPPSPGEFEFPNE
ncbi:MAG: hypothetical protein ACTSU5_00915 [Promethearchaeota archaeon]